MEIQLGSAQPAGRPWTKLTYTEKCSCSLYFSDPESGGDEVRGISNPLITAVNSDWRATSREIPRQEWDLGWDAGEETCRLVLKPRGSPGRKADLGPPERATEPRWAARGCSHCGALPGAEIPTSDFSSW